MCKYNYTQIEFSQKLQFLDFTPLTGRVSRVDHEVRRGIRVYPAGGGVRKFGFSWGEGAELGEEGGGVWSTARFSGL